MHRWHIISIFGIMQKGGFVMLEINTKAPSFNLPDEEGNMHTLEEYRGHRVILYFYPRDNTPGCSKQACGFRDLYPEFCSGYWNQ